MNKTAVQWLYESLILNESNPAHNNWVLDKAKIMEKEQVIKVFVDVSKEAWNVLGRKLTLQDIIDFQKIAEVYYNEEFKSK